MLEPQSASTAHVFLSAQRAAAGTFTGPSVSATPPQSMSLSPAFFCAILVGRGDAGPRRAEAAVAVGPVPAGLADRALRSGRAATIDVALPVVPFRVGGRRRRTLLRLIVAHPLAVGGGGAPGLRRGGVGPGPARPGIGGRRLRVGGTCRRLPARTARRHEERQDDEPEGVGFSHRKQVTQVSRPRERARAQFGTGRCARSRFRGAHASSAPLPGAEVTCR